MKRKLCLILFIFEMFLKVQCDLPLLRLRKPTVNAESEVKNIEHDFIIIGGGIAGSIVANRLSENPNWNVLVLEANDEPGFKLKKRTTLYDWNKYATRAAGKGLKQSISPWSWSSIIQYFEKSLDNGYIGRDAISVTPKYNRKLTLMDGYRERGLKYLIDGNASEYMGIADVLRSSSETQQKLEDASKLKQKKNLRVKYNVVVTNFNVDNEGNIESVSFVTKSKQRMKAVANKEYILSAGTYFSPKILMQSGLGPKEHLKELGIMTIRDLSVGRNLQEHVVVPFFAKVSTSSKVHSVIYNYSNIDHISLTSTKKELTHPDIMSSWKIVSLGDRPSMKKELDGFSLDKDLVNIIMQALDQHDVMIVGIYSFRPQSAGAVRLRTKNPMDPPLIYHNLLNNPSDVKTLIRGIRQQQELLVATSNENQSFEEITPYLDHCADKSPDSDEFWECYIRIAASPLDDSVGTCKMGPESDKLAVVNPCFQVHKTINLRIIDESVIPRVTNGPTIYSTEKLAQSGADFIIDDWTEN